MTTSWLAHSNLGRWIDSGRIKNHVEVFLSREKGNGAATLPKYKILVTPLTPSEQSGVIIMKQP